jgi:integrase/recombinase XerD
LHRGKSATTVITYLHALKQFKEWLDGAGTDLVGFSRSDVQQYIDYLVSKKQSVATINKVFNAIKKYCKYAKKIDCIEDIAVIKQPDYKQQAPKALDKIERNRLLSEVDRAGNRRDIAIVITLLHIGFRVSELVAVDRNDVEISERKGLLKVRLGKGAKEREVQLSAEASRAISKYLEERSDDEPALFISNRGTRISVRSVQHLFEKHGLNFHLTRHTFITRLVRSGQDISVIKSLSGHSSADMILRYSMPTEEDKLQADEGLYK